MTHLKELSPFRVEMTGQRQAEKYRGGGIFIVLQDEL